MNSSQSAVSTEVDATYDSAQPLLDEFPFQIDVEWTQTAGIHRIDDGRVAKLTLMDQDYIGHFSGLTLSIVSKTTGPIDVTYLAFHPYVKSFARDSTPLIRLIRGRWGWDGYSETPDLHAYVSAVESYIDYWR